MVAAGAILKPLYPKLFHVAWVESLLQNRAMKVKSHFGDIHQLITKVKLAAVKNKIRQDKFATIDCLPQSVVTKREKLVKCYLVLSKEFTQSKSSCRKF